MAYVSTLYKDDRRQIVLSRIASDCFKKPRARIAKIFGVSSDAERFCKKVAPNGKWTLYTHITATDHYQFSIWYNDFTPYAISMMNFEEGFECFGIDFTSINAYWRSVMGYYYVGNDMVSDEDSDLFGKVYLACGEVYEASLPAMDMFFTAAVWVCIKSKRYFNAYFKKYPNSSMLPKIAQVIERLKMPVPDHLSKFLIKIKKK